MEACTQSVQETEAFGVAYAATLSAGDVVTLDGDLGAGKTAFARGVMRGMGYQGRVTSPTFAIANEYDTPRGIVGHFDMYRILNTEALYELGFEEYLDGQRILLIEWSRNIAQALPAHYKTVQIAYGAAEDARIITTGESL